jgi:hypothetical protein
VVFDAAWPFATAGRAVQLSSSATQDNTANDDVANWCVALNEYDAVNHLLGTPAAANRDCNVSETICNDNLDNDGDGQIDCADANCVGQTGSLGEVCQATETTCDDGFDNDRDSLVDCDDPNCAGLMGPGGIACASGSMTLFFSEYIEGSSNNKAFEIYNPFGTDYDLSNCSVKLYANGAVTATTTANLTGTLASHDVYVICNSSSNAGILAVCDLQNGTANYNGDDALELVCGGVTVDVIGQIGVQVIWGTSPTITQNATIRRKCGITDGDAVGSDAFDPAVEWDGFAIDTIDGLGSHTVTCK